MKTAKNLFRTVGVVFGSAPGLTVLKLLVAGAIALVSPATVLVLQHLIDRVTEFGVHFDGATVLLVSALVLCALCGTAGGNLAGLIDLKIKYRLSRRISQTVIAKYRAIDYACFEDKTTLDKIEKMGASPEGGIFEAFTGAISAVSCLVSIAGHAAVLWQMSWLFSLVYVLMLAPLFYFDYKCCSVMDRMFDRQSTNERLMKYYMRLLSEKQSVFELRIFRAVPFILELWKSTNNKVLSERIKTTLKAQKYLIFSSLTFLTWSAYLVYAIISKASAGELTVGLAIALVSAITAIQSGVSDFIWTFESLSETLVITSYYRDFLALPNSPATGDKNVDGDFVIKFENVCFTYPGSESPALKNISFEFQSSEHLALVGKNGSGKTTTVKLLCRFYRPDSGRITVNGTDLWELTEESIHAMFGAIFQDYGRYKLSLRENVAFGDIEKLEDDGHLLSALEKAGFASDADRLSRQYGKLVEDSTDLSGGQWQRVALARAYAAKGRFTIMDEPTSALDPMAESELYRSFLSIMDGHGCLVISHRLASAKLAQRIIVLDGGEIIQQGTHDELASSPGLYGEMWAMQSEMYKGGAEHE